MPSRSLGVLQSWHTFVYTTAPSSPKVSSVCGEWKWGSGYLPKGDCKEEKEVVRSEGKELLCPCETWILSASSEVVREPIKCQVNEGNLETCIKVQWFCELVLVKALRNTCLCYEAGMSFVSNLTLLFLLLQLRIDKAVDLEIPPSHFTNHLCIH